MTAEFSSVPVRTSVAPFASGSYYYTLFLIYRHIDAAGMGVDIPDITIVIQWDISEHLTLAMLWQRIGRAGRDPNLNALAIVFIFDKHVLPLAIPGESIWSGFNHPVDHTNIEQTKEFVGKFYNHANLSSTTRSTALTAYHKVDPPILWYLNTSGCRARSMMASFVDTAAFSSDPRRQDCCDNCLYNAEAGSNSELPEFRKHRFDISISMRYLQSTEYCESQIPAALQAAEERIARAASKPTRTQRTAVRQAIDSWAFEHFGYLHRRLFLPGVREKLADSCPRAVDQEAVQEILDNAQFCLHESALYPELSSLIERINETLRDISVNPSIPIQVEEFGPATGPELCRQPEEPLSLCVGRVGDDSSEIHHAQHIGATESRDWHPGRSDNVPQLEGEEDKCSASTLLVATHEGLDNLLHDGNPQKETVNTCPVPANALISIPDRLGLEPRVTTDKQGSLDHIQPEASEIMSFTATIQNPILVSPVTMRTNTHDAQYTVLTPQVPIAEPEIKIPHNLPPGVTQEMYLRARQSVISNMVLASDLQPTTKWDPTPSGNSERGDTKTHEGELEDKDNSNTQACSRRKRKQRTSDSQIRELKGNGVARGWPKDPLGVARRAVEVRALQIENCKRKRAMKDLENTGKGRKTGGEE